MAFAVTLTFYVWAVIISLQSEVVLIDIASLCLLLHFVLWVLCHLEISCKDCVRQTQEITLKYL